MHFLLTPPREIRQNATLHSVKIQSHKQRENPKGTQNNEQVTGQHVSKKVRESESLV